jgi:hypothetical protein
MMDGWMMNERFMGGRRNIDGFRIYTVGYRGKEYQTGWRLHTTISAVGHRGEEYQTGWRRHTTISAVGHRGKEYIPN